MPSSQPAGQQSKLAHGAPARGGLHAAVTQVSRLTRNAHECLRVDVHAQVLRHWCFCTWRCVAESCGCEWVAELADVPPRVPAALPAQLCMHDTTPHRRTRAHCRGCAHLLLPHPTPPPPTHPPSEARQGLTQYNDGVLHQRLEALARLLAFRAGEVGQLLDSGRILCMPPLDIQIKNVPQGDVQSSDGISQGGCHGTCKQ